MKHCPKCKLLNDNMSMACTSCAFSLAGVQKIEDQIAVEDRSRFKITDFVGEGSFGRVYRCHDSKFNKLVALKILKEDCRKNRLTLDLFKRECDFSSNIGEEHLVSMLEYRITPAFVYSVMEFVEGVDMNIYIKDLDSMTLSTFRKIAGQIAAGLNFFHYHGLLHCDLKPANIMISPETLKLKIIDLGLSHFKFEENVLEKDMVAGTRGYMSPEQAAGSKALNQASDIYSVGAICYELLTGTLPKFDANYKLILPSALISISGGGESARDKADASSGAETFRKLAGDLDEIVVKCLSPDPKDRYKNAMEFVNAFKKLNLSKEGEAVIHRLLKKGKVSLAALGYAHEDPIQLKAEEQGEPSGITAVLDKDIIGGTIGKDDGGNAARSEDADEGQRTSKTQLVAKSGDGHPALDFSIVSGHKSAANESLKKEQKSSKTMVGDIREPAAAKSFSLMTALFFTAIAVAMFFLYNYLQKPLSLSLTKKSDTCEAGTSYDMSIIEPLASHIGGRTTRADVTWAPSAGDVQGTKFIAPSIPMIVRIEARIKTSDQLFSETFYLSVTNGKADLFVAYVQDGRFGEKGSGEGQYNGISDISPERGGTLLITDTANSRIIVTDPKGKFIRAFGFAGQADDRLKLPSSAAAGQNGSTFVVDTGNNRIMKFDQNRSCVARFGKKGDANGEFDLPTAASCDGDGNLYVVDRNNNRIQKFGPDGSFIKKRGKKGGRPAEFDGPWGVAAGPDGLVYVTDGGNGRVQVFDSNLNFVAAIGGPGKGNLQFMRPCSIKCASDGTVFVAEPENSRVQSFNIKSGKTAVIALDSRIARPTVAAADGSGTLFISDAEGFGVSRFSQSKTNSK